MKRVILLPLIISSLFSQTIVIENKWDLLGATEDINNMGVFSSDCVESIWQYKDAKWISYTSPNSNIEAISKGDGFWLKGNKECSIDTNANLSIEFSLSSNDIEDGKEMDTKHGMDWDKYGEANNNISPHLKWSNSPSEVKSFAIEMIDLDYQNSLHWAIVNIPSSVNELSSGVNSDYLGMSTLVNAYEESSYTGPFPPKGQTHRYQITIYAISKESVNSLDEAKANSITFTYITSTFSW